MPILFKTKSIFSMFVSASVLFASFVSLSSSHAASATYTAQDFSESKLWQGANQTKQSISIEEQIRLRFSTLGNLLELLPCLHSEQKKRNELDITIGLFVGAIKKGSSGQRIDFSAALSALRKLRQQVILLENENDEFISNLVFIINAEIEMLNEMMTSSKSNPPTFSAWAAENANEIAKKYKSSSSIAAILGDVAVGRYLLALEMKNLTIFDNPKENKYLTSFGASRFGSKGDRCKSIKDALPYGKGWPRPSRTELEFSKAHPTFPGMIDRIKTLLEPEGLRFGDKPTRIQRKYTMMSNQEVDSCVVELKIGQAGETVVLSPVQQISRAVTIFRDAIKRLEYVRKHPELSLEERLTHFKIAMNGYYVAHPYRRGGAAIGRAFFAGIYLGMFGKKIPLLPDGFDVENMVMGNQKASIAKYVQVLK